MAWPAGHRRPPDAAVRWLPPGPGRRDHLRRASGLVGPPVAAPRLLLRRPWAGSCATGDCGGVLRCDGRPGATPATVVEMTLGTPRSPLHFYDVSLVDGFNAPVSMSPVGGGAGCGVAGCQADLNVCCPSALEVRDREGKVAGCRSACRAMGGDRYCCTGDYASPERCRPTVFAHVFKAVCPKAYSYAYDDATSLNRCKASRYLITFCPPPTSRK
ncbi:thaumatin-like protein [Panicum miliaceum]|uniref:Thaumatin-like protein n=1 Tax=Panicum miliaceum TaxID=4540 RepID=A0A3L6PIU4_PANMI|nr:thaumatin-like protein [Panicum miliaceum]